MIAILVGPNHVRHGQTTDSIGTAYSNFSIDSLLYLLLLLRIDLEFRKMLRFWAQNYSYMVVSFLSSALYQRTAIFVKFFRIVLILLTDVTNSDVDGEFLSKIERRR